MKKFSIFIIFLLIIVAGTFVFIKQTPSFKQTKGDKVEHQLIVTLLPQKQIVKKIAGEKFSVTGLIPPGFNPATYDPTVEEMKMVVSAEMYFRTGHVLFEKTHIEELIESNPSMLVVDTSKNNSLRELEAHTHHDEAQEHDDHEEGNDDKTEHESGIDPHVWLSPLMVQKQAAIIYESLAKQYPEYADEFSVNYEEIIKDLEELDKELKVAFAPIKGKTILVYHPAFGYLARDYGFTQEHIEIEGKEPSIEDIQNIIEEANEDNVSVIFVQKQFSKDSAKAVADNIEGVVLEIDPLAEDYFTNMKTMAHTITDSFNRN